MPRNKREKQTLQKDDSIEPAAKNRKLDQPPAKKSKVCLICKLPNELLEKIIGYISYWHRPRLRKTCRRMRNVCDSLLLHEFQKSILYYKHFDPNGFNCAALTAIKDAIWPYVYHGFESIFCGTILPLIWNSTNFSPSRGKIKSFLRNFYKLVDARIGDTYSQFSRLLYTVTLMRLLRRFRNSKVVASVRILPNYWRIVLELHGPWIGVLWSSKSVSESNEHVKLLMILCELMIADTSQQAFKKVWECDSEVFVYGNDTTERWERMKNTMTVFTFSVSAPQKIVTLLKSSLEDDLIEWPKRIPKNDFVVSLDIDCKEALKWGCCQVHHIEIGPDFELSNDRDNEQAEEQGSHELRRTVSGMSSETIVEID